MKKLLLFLLLCGILAVATAQSGLTYKMSASDMERMERAVQAYNKGRYRQSIDLLHQLERLYPNNPDIYFHLGLNAVKRNYNASGIRRYFTKVIQLAPTYPDAVAHFYMGVIHYTDNQFDQAVDDFNRYFSLANSQGTPESDALYMEASNYLYWSQFLAEAYRNIAPYHPQVVTGVSSTDDELLPFFSHDGTQCYFLRYASVASPTTIHNRELETKELKLFSAIRRDTAFLPARILPPPFNQGDPEGSVSLTADNRELFYSVIRRFRGYNNSDIYHSRFDGSRWTPIANLGDSVNGSDCWDSQPSVSPDGNTLYFASNRKGGLGGTDIWRCRRKADGSWAAPTSGAAAAKPTAPGGAPSISAPLSIHPATRSAPSSMPTATPSFSPPTDGRALVAATSTLSTSTATHSPVPSTSACRSTPRKTTSPLVYSPTASMLTVPVAPTQPTASAVPMCSPLSSTPLPVPKP